MTATADEIIRLLELEPHPEGGWFRQTWVAPTSERRAAGTAIYFLLTADEVSHWHRIDSAEIWHHYAGAALELRTWADGDPAVVTRILGDDLAGNAVSGGQRPQLVVAPGDWQWARTLGPWTLVGCTVSPGFEFERFELAPAGWEPPVGGQG